MRDRHFPRLCSSCRAPMARQEDACWRCGVQWASEGRPRNALRVIGGGAQSYGWSAVRDQPPAALALEAT